MSILDIIHFKPNRYKTKNLLYSFWSCIYNYLFCFKKNDPFHRGIL